MTSESRPFAARAFWLGNDIIRLKLDANGRRYDHIFDSAQAREVRDALTIALREAGQDNPQDDPQKMFHRVMGALFGRSAPN